MTNLNQLQNTANFIEHMKWHKKYMDIFLKCSKVFMRIYSSVLRRWRHYRFAFTCSLSIYPIDNLRESYYMAC